MGIILLSELQLKQSFLANNVDIRNSIQSSLANLNNYKDEAPSVSALITQSIKQLSRVAEYDFKINDKKYAKTTTIRDTLGESIPPLVLEIIIKNLINLSKNPNTIYQKTEQQKLIFILLDTNVE